MMAARRILFFIIILPACSAGFLGAGFIPARGVNAAAVAVSSPGLSLSQVEINPMVRVSMHTGEDFDPAIHPGGKALAYVSDRDGALNLWVRSLQGTWTGARPVTTGSAGNSDPAWSPDGRYLAYRSNLTDPRGDIYIVGINPDTGRVTEPSRRVTGREWGDGEPAWDKDGSHLFISAEKGGLRQIHRVSIKDGSRKVITAGGQPALSPDGSHLVFSRWTGRENKHLFLLRLQDGAEVHITGGDVLDGFPAFSGDSRWVYFVRYAVDTDGDGRLTTSDRPDLWRMGLRWLPGPQVARPGGLRTLTSLGTYDQFPVPFGRTLYFTSNTPRGVNVFRIPEEGLIPILSDPAEALRRARRMAKQYPDETHLVDLAYSVISQDYRDPASRETVDASRFELAARFKERGELPRALQVLEDILGPGFSPLYEAMARVELASIRAEMRRNPDGSLIREAAESSLAEIQEIVRQRRGVRRAQALALIRSGDLLAELRDSAGALDMYEAMVTRFSEEQDLVAEALYRKNRLYILAGDRNTLIVSLANMIRRIPSTDRWVQRAVNDIVSLIEEEAGPKNATAALGEMARTPDIAPALAAQCLLRAAALHHLNGDNALALDTYRELLERFADQTAGEGFIRIRSSARLAMANIFTEQADYRKSVAICAGLIDDPDTPFEIRHKARIRYSNSMLSKAEDEVARGEYRLAVKTYLELLERAPEFTPAHRGLVAAYAALGEVERAVQKAQAWIKEEGGKAVHHYALGLALTYLKPPQFDQAFREISLAIDREGQDPYFHQTLGWLLEQKESMSPGSDYLEAALESYRAALGLMDPREFPRDYANLLLNMGNAAFLLGNQAAAYTWYRRRELSGRPFVGADLKPAPAQERIYLMRYGRAAYHVGKSDEAADLFSKALEMTPADDKKALADLQGFLGLVYQDQMKYDLAVDAFSRQATLSQELRNEEMLTRALRNIANNLYFLSHSTPVKDHGVVLERALSAYREVLQKLPDVFQDEKGGGFGLKLLIGGLQGDELTGAAGGFDRWEEEKMIFQFIGRIYADAGESRAAIDAFEKKLAVLEKTGGDTPAARTERAIVLNQIGMMHWQTGESEKALEQFMASMQLCLDMDNRYGAAVNAANSSLLLAHMAMWGDRTLLKDPGVLEKLEGVFEALPSGEERIAPIIATGRNALGILRYMFSMDDPAPLKKIDISSVGSWLLQARQQLAHMEKAEAHFRIGLQAAASLPGAMERNAVESVLRRNLAQIDAAALPRKGGPTYSAEERVDSSPRRLRWKLLFLDALNLENASDPKDQAHRKDLLAKAAGELEALLEATDKPNISKDVMSRIMIEDLFAALALEEALAGNWEQAMGMAEKGSRLSWMSSGKAQFKTPDIPIDRVEAVDVQNTSLYEGDLLLRFIYRRGRILILSMTVNSLEGVVRTLASPARRLADGLWSKREESTVLDDNDSEAWGNSVLSPLASRIHSAKRVYLIADGVLARLPWPTIPVQGVPLAKSVPLCEVGSLAHLFIATHRANLSADRLLTVSLPPGVSVPDAFSPVRVLERENASVSNLEADVPHYGIVVMGGGIQVTPHSPEDSMVRLKKADEGLERISVRAFPSVPGANNLLIITGGETLGGLPMPPASPLCARILAESGFPTLLLKTGKWDPDTDSAFLSYFLKNLVNSTPADAFRKTADQLWGKHKNKLNARGFRLYGFAGMNREEARLFAKEHYRESRKKALKAFKEQNWAEAASSLDRLLILMRASGKLTGIENVWYAAAIAAKEAGQMELAERFAGDLVRYRLEERANAAEQADALYLRGIIRSGLEKFDDAIKDLKAALDLYRESSELKSLIQASSQLGVVQESAGDYDRALEMFRYALSVQKKAGTPKGEAEENRRIGRIYYKRLDQYAAALDHFEQAETLSRKAGDLKGLALALLDQGLVYERMADFQRAMELYQAGFAAATRAGDELTALRASIYQSNTNWFRGRYQEAFSLLRRIIRRAQELDDPSLLNLGYNTLGLVHWTLNDPERAKDNLRKALEMAKRARSPIDEAGAYNNLGLVLRWEKKYDQAMEMFRKARKIDRSRNSAWGEAYDLRNIGMTRRLMGDASGAMAPVSRAVELSKKIGDRVNLAKALLELGFIRMELSEAEEAVKNLQRALELSERLDIPEVTWRALHGLGRERLAGGKKGAAIEYYRRAVEIVEQMRATIRIEELKSGFLVDKQELYHELISILLDEGQASQAFEYAERARARNFIDILGNRNPRLKSKAEETLVRQLEEVARNIRLTQSALAADDSREKEALAKRLKSLRRRHRDLLVDIKAQNPQLFQMVSVEAISVEGLSSLLPREVALVEYVVMKDRIAVWVIKKSGMTWTSVAMPRAELRRLVKGYRRRIQQIGPLAGLPERLYRTLISPITAYLEDVKILAVVPHDILHYLAFASLKAPEGHLIDRYAIFYLSSASITPFLYKLPPRNLEKKEKALALGNPQLAGMNYDLPLAEMEAASLRWNFPQLELLLKDRARESRLKEDIGQYRVIHIASHGEFNELNPLFSALKLTGDQQDDGNLEVNEIFALPLQADLVALSACQTGLGEIGSGDELIGLTRAFFYSGARSIISSLWRVDDLSTALVMKHFYRLYHDENKAESLRRAQLTVRRSFHHPAYWAGLSLFGDFR
ncbi:MAG: CHAT domain-containing protein [Deltaproteobacteria bacterium]|nr:CHAT domain-containing protein [Deltaproteobacteria bacterium]